jgi:hypothetical protein
MCQAVTCAKCGKAGWRGCGAHVEQVLAGVPAAQRCTCAGGAQSKPLGDSLREMFGIKK